MAKAMKQTAEENSFIQSQDSEPDTEKVTYLNPEEEEEEGEAEVGLGGCIV